MNPQILESYLISLGFEPDQSSYRKFMGVLSTVDESVGHHAGGMLGSILKMQIGIVGAFTSVSAAIVGMMDHVAMADQGYRLYGLSMLMTTDSARKLKMITEGLGASMEQIIWDPELHARAQQMSADIDDFSHALGGDFESNMKGIRDVRFEFTRLENSMQFLGMGVVNELFKQLTGSSADLSTTIDGWIQYLKDNLPEISKTIADDLVPVLKDTWEILKDVKDVTIGAFDVFASFVALLTGDDSINETSNDFDKMAKVMKHVTEEAKAMFDAIKSAEIFAKNILTGHWSEAFHNISEGGAAVLGAGAAGTLAAGAAPVVGGLIAGPFGVAAGLAVEPLVVPAVGAAGAFLGAQTQRLGHSYDNDTGPHGTPIADHTDDPGFLHNIGNYISSFWNSKAVPDIKASSSNAKPTDYLDHIAKTMRLDDSSPKPAARDSLRWSLSHLQPDQTAVVAQIVKEAMVGGVDPTLALAVAHHESRFKENAVSKVGALGIFQLMPKTAAGLGVDPHDASQNIHGGVTLLGQLLTQFHGDIPLALAAYDAGPGAVKKYGGIPPYDETQNYVKSIMGTLADERNSESESSIRDDARDSIALRSGAATSVAAAPPAPRAGDRTVKIEQNIGPISVIRPGADDRAIRRAITEGGLDILEEQTQTDLTQFSTLN